MQEVIMGRRGVYACVSEEVILQSPEYRKRLKECGNNSKEAIYKVLHSLGFNTNSIEVDKGIVRCAKERFSGYVDTIYRGDIRKDSKHATLWKDVTLDILACDYPPSNKEVVDLHEVGKNYRTDQIDNGSKARRAPRQTKFKPEKEEN